MRQILAISRTVVIGWWQGDAWEIGSLISGSFTTEVHDVCSICPSPEATWAASAALGRDCLRRIRYGQHNIPVYVVELLNTNCHTSTTSLEEPDIVQPMLLPRLSAGSSVKSFMS